MNESERVDAAEASAFESDLVDLGDLPLTQLRVAADSALAHALRRLVEDVNDPDDVIAGFQSAI